MIHLIDYNFRHGYKPELERQFLATERKTKKETMQQYAVQAKDKLLQFFELGTELQWISQRMTALQMQQKNGEDFVRVFSSVYGLISKSNDVLRAFKLPSSYSNVEYRDAFAALAKFESDSLSKEENIVQKFLTWPDTDSAVALCHALDKKTNFLLTGTLDDTGEDQLSDAGAEKLVHSQGVVGEMFDNQSLGKNEEKKDLT